MVNSKRWWKVIFTILAVYVSACNSTNEKSNELIGSWDAMWQTDPAGYPGLSNEFEFTMKGKFFIEQDSITIEGYGYKGCVFSEDTIHHKLVWKLREDSLILFNDPETPGLVYKIRTLEDNSVKLQLEDIFVTLSK